jgi:hypothetical protein
MKHWQSVHYSEQKNNITNLPSVLIITVGFNRRSKKQEILALATLKYL